MLFSFHAPCSFRGMGRSPPAVPAGKRPPQGAASAVRSTAGAAPHFPAGLHGLSYISTRMGTVFLPSRFSSM